jgi:hypothetical protein
MFLHAQSTQTLRVDNPCFFQMSFFSTKCAPFLLKIGEDFSIDDYKGKRTWIDEFFIYNPFEHIRFKSVFDPKMDFESVALTKVVHEYVIKGMNA